MIVEYQLGQDDLPLMSAVLVLKSLVTVPEAGKGEGAGKIVADGRFQTLRLSNGFSSIGPT